MPNPYPSNFTDLIRPGDVALDLGCGDRRHATIIGMEYRWTESADFLGDCLSLPLADDCADLVLSQAVLEHVVDPQRAVDEMRRVLRPGGLLYVEAAFMQPVHMAPHHYFNITPYGLRYLLRDWEVEWEAPVGTFREVVYWVYQAAGTSPPARVPQVTGGGMTLTSCGVSALARKPV